MWLQLIATTLLLLLLVCGTRARTFVEDETFWMSVGKSELHEAVNVAVNTKTAKNVIVFIADGMGPNTVTATRIYKHGESGRLTFEKFPHIGLLKTYSVNKQVPDSASAATAMFTGVKVNQKTIGLDASYNYDDPSYCNSIDDSAAQRTGLESLATWAQAAGKHTGFVTNSRLTDATVAALYARTSNRKWECDAAMPDKAKNGCKDIARQLIEDEPGRNFKVIMGGGKKSFDANATKAAKDVLDKHMCTRTDGRNLTRAWIEDKTSRQSSYQYLNNIGDMKSLDTERTEYILGMFTNGFMPMEYHRFKNMLDVPSLEMMTETALKVLSKSEKGFFLMVEGGLIDVAHHHSMARLALDETVEFDKTINTTLKLLKQWNMLDDTLVIVTSDHANLLSINGYPNRGNNILDVAGKSHADQVKYTTLTYSIGYSVNPIYTRAGTEVIRQDPTIYKTTSHEYTQQVGIQEDTGIHGGSDVAVYAKGPMGHLFHSIHEQNYIAHVIAYAAKMGPYQEGLNKSCINFSNIYLSCTLMLILLYLR